jgi:branched-chain amino acid transport system ATP-binding protein
MGRDALSLLQVEQATVEFGGLRALSEVDLDVPAGQITGLIGPNGAGKTTLFNVICGLQETTAGRVLFDEADISSAGTHARARMGIGRTFQRLEIFGSLTVRENILVAAEIRKRWAKDSAADPRADADRVLDLIGMREKQDARSDALSTGMCRLMELGRALATRPRLLLLDEPSSGLDESETDYFAQLLERLTAEGLAVLIVEHDVELVMRLCKRIHVLDFGRKIAAGTPPEIQANQAVQAAYLGTTEGSDDSAA